MVDAELNAHVLERLARCLAYFASRGYTFVSLPWVAPARYTNATRPAYVTTPDLVTPHGNLLASGEQSFLMLREQARLPQGPCIGWTPCFRQESPYDESHHFNFMKAELYAPVASWEQGQELMLQMQALAQRWMQQEMHRAGVNIRVECDPQGIYQADLCVRVPQYLELGSYGVREFDEQLYVYGTACAEPRFSLAVRRALEAQPHGDR